MIPIKDKYLYLLYRVFQEILISFQFDQFLFKWFA